MSENSDNLDTINLQHLREAATSANERQARWVITNLPGRVGEAAEMGEAWRVVTSFVSVPGLDRLAVVDDAMRNLPGAVKLVYDHLRDAGLNPGFIACTCKEGKGKIYRGEDDDTHGLVDRPSPWPIEGQTYRLVARWDIAPEDHPLRRLYEASVQDLAGQITNSIPGLVAEAATAGRWWVPVYTFFTVPHVGPLGFYGDPAELSGIPRLVYDFLSREELEPQLIYTERRGKVGGFAHHGRLYRIVARWHNAVSEQA